MNTDYVREVVNDRAIDIPWARRSLLDQARRELQPVAETRPVPALLWGAYIGLLGTVDPAQVRRIVDDLCRVMDERFGDVHAVAIPDDHAHPSMEPDAEHALATAADRFGDIAAILKALDILAWVLAYDEIQPPVFEDDDPADETES